MSGNREFIGELPDDPRVREALAKVEGSTQEQDGIKALAHSLLGNERELLIAKNHGILLRPHSLEFETMLARLKMFGNFSPADMGFAWLFLRGAKYARVSAAMRRAEVLFEAVEKECQESVRKAEDKPAAESLAHARLADARIDAAALFMERISEWLAEVKISQAALQEGLDFLIEAFKEAAALNVPEKTDKAGELVTGSIEKKNESLGSSEPLTSS